MMFAKQCLWRRRLLWLSVSVLVLPLVGCTEGGYPELEATTFIGRTVPCAQCDRQIEAVTEKNLMTFQGVVYPVCDQKCADELKAWLEQQ